MRNKYQNRLEPTAAMRTWDGVPCTIYFEVAQGLQYNYRTWASIPDHLMANVALLFAAISGAAGDVYIKDVGLIGRRDSLLGGTRAPYLTIYLKARK